VSKGLSRSVTFGGEAPGSAQRRFRAEIPERSLRKRQWRTFSSNYVLTPQTPKEIRKDPRIRGWNGPGTRIIDPTTFVTIRLVDDVVIDPHTGRVVVDYKMDNMAEEIRRAREAGQYVIVDIDDDLWHIPSWSPAATAMHKLAPNIRAYNLETIEANIRACDAVFVSTAHLGKIVLEAVPDAPPVHIMRPGVDPSAYRWPLQRQPGPLRVGWMGSMSHHAPHLRTMMEALDVLDKYDATFVRIGKIDRDETQDPIMSELPCSKIVELPWGKIDELPEKLSMVDIGIIPRVLSDFNEGQSVTSGLQYAAGGIPFLVSPSAEYRLLETTGAGRICRNVHDWRQGLMDLLEYQDCRQSESAAARECVLSAYGLEATGERYAQVLEEMASAD
jgi:glycosyltransferase involved in cell wall biosynthesis